MKNPIDALIVKLGNKSPTKADADDAYDVDRDAKLDQMKKVIKAIQSNKPDLALDAMCALMDLHEPSPPALSEDDED